MAEHGVDGLVYGHFGDGCVHVRIDLPLADAPERMRPFMTDAARLVASHGGSFSGEHGDGRARSELLPLMYSPEAIALFGRFKHLLDPDGLLNPGVLVDPRPLDADLRRPGARPLLASGGFPFAHDGGDVTTTRAPLHRRRQVPRRPVRQRRLHVPVVPGDQGREGLHPRPRARPAGDGERLCAAAGLGVAGGARGARPVPVVQGLRQRLPHRHRHGHVQVRGAVPDLPRTRPSAAALPARPAAALGPARRRRRRAGQRHRSPSLLLRKPLLRLGGMDPRRSVPRFAARAVPALAHPARSRPATALAARCCSGSTRSPTPSTPPSPQAAVQAARVGGLRR